MGVAIRTAGADDRELVARLLDSAFQDDPVSGWIFPGEEERRTIHPRLMAAFVDIVLAEGRVDVTEDGAACALWLPVPAESADGHDDEDGFAQLREALDPGNERIELIGRLTAEVHPSGRAHEYLWMVGVAPERQGRDSGPRSSGRFWSGATGRLCPPTWRRAARGAGGCTSGSALSWWTGRSTCRTDHGCGPCGASRALRDSAGTGRPCGVRAAGCGLRQRGGRSCSTAVCRCLPPTGLTAGSARSPLALP